MTIRTKALNFIQDNPGCSWKDIVTFMLSLKGMEYNYKTRGWYSAYLNVGRGFKNSCRVGILYTPSKKDARTIVKIDKKYYIKGQEPKEKTTISLSKDTVTIPMLPLILQASSKSLNPKGSSTLIVMDYNRQAVDIYENFEEKALIESLDAEDIENWLLSNPFKDYNLDEIEWMVSNGEDFQINYL